MTASNKSKDPQSSPAGEKSSQEGCLWRVGKFCYNPVKKKKGEPCDELEKNKRCPRRSPAN
jgi:hypothetical protein